MNNLQAREKEEKIIPSDNECEMKTSREGGGSKDRWSASDCIRRWLFGG